MKNFKIVKMLQLCNIAILVGAIAGCNSGINGNTPASDSANFSPTSTKIAKKQPNLKNDFFILQPGAGFDTSTNTAVSDQSCLRAAQSFNNLYVANPKAAVSMGDNITFSNLETSLGVNLSGDMGGGIFSGSMRAAYLQNIEDTNYTLNLNYIYQYAGIVAFKPGTIKQAESALTQVAKSYAFGGDPVRFRKMCGNEFISQMNAGVFLGVSITLNFDSSQDKNAFLTAINGKAGPIGSITAQIQTAAQNANINVKMSLSALQLGGQPQKLNDIFGSVDPYGNYPYLDCGNVESGGYNACEHMMDNVITYGKSIKYQVESGGQLINLQNLYYTNATREKYDRIGVYANAPDPSPQVQQAAQKIVKMYNDAMFNYNFTQHYLNTVANLDTISQVVLQGIAYHYNNQINGVYMNDAYNILDCYRGYISNDCPQIESNVEAALAQSPYALSERDHTILNYFKNNIYKGKIYGYSGQGTDQISDYSLERCIFYPTSPAQFQQYVVSCQKNTFFPMISGNLTITQVPMPGNQYVLSINGLQYNAINPEFPIYSEPVSYPSGLILSPVSGIPGSFYLQPVNVTGGNSFKTSTASLSLTQLTRAQI